MKQGILIIAHRNPEWVERIIKTLGPDFYYFLHFDVKVNHSDKSYFGEIAYKYKLSFCTSRYKVNWGSVNHCKAIILLIEMALKKGMDYCHLITGQDYPVKNTDYFIKQLNTEYSYLHHFSLPVDGWGLGGLDRLTFYHLHNIFDHRKLFGRLVIRMLVNMQKKVGFSRKLPENIKFYCGSAYWSLKRDCLLYIINYLKRYPNYLEIFEHSVSAEEILFQTILLNSDHKNCIVNSHRRYICWERRNGSMPAILDESDYGSIVASDALFARKIDYPISEKLIEIVDNYIHSKE